MLKFHFAIFLFFSACSNPTPRDWKPKAVAGPLEVRDLPPQSALTKDYHEWLSRGPKVARVYEITLREDVFTNNFTFEQKPARTPLGKPIYTFCDFHRSQPEYDRYQFEFDVKGRFPSNVFNFSKGKKVWVQPLGTNFVNNQVRLDIVAIEGVPAFTTIVADR